MPRNLVITYAAIIILLAIPFNGIIQNTSAENIDKGGDWNPWKPPKDFEDLFLPHCFENGTWTFDVPEYMHNLTPVDGFIWLDEYLGPAEYSGHYAELNITDNVDVYIEENNTMDGAPYGGTGWWAKHIKGSKITIRVIGKVRIILGISGSWFGDILGGGTYTITFSGKRISLWTYYYNPTNIDTFYFKSNKPIYAYLFSDKGEFLDKTDKAVKEGYLTEPYDACPFLVFERGDGVEGNITVEFWAGLKPHTVDYTWVGILTGIFIAVIAFSYIFGKRMALGKRRKR